MNRIRFYLIIGILSLLPSFLMAQSIEWEEITSGLESPQVFGLHEDNSGGIYATTSGGLYYSPNYGDSWEWVCDSAGFNTFIIFDTNIIVGFKFNICYRTTDRGKTWKAIYNFPAVDTWHRLTTDYLSTIYYTTRPTKTSQVLYRSTDKGLTWSNVTKNIVSGESLWIDDGMVALPNGYAIVNNQYGSAPGYYVTHDYGETWKLKSGIVSTYPITGDKNGNVWILEKIGSTDTQKLYLSDTSLAAFKEYKMIANESSEKSTSYPESTHHWSLKSSYIEKLFVLLPKDSSIVIRRNGKLAAFKIRYSRGKVPVSTFVVDKQPFQTEFLMQGRNGYIYAGTRQGLYRTKDTCKSWERTCHGMTKGSDIYDIQITPNGIITATSGGIYRSNDNLRTWQYLSDSIHIGLTASVYRTNNGNLLAGTTLGAYYSSDNGNRWQPLSIPLYYSVTSFLQLPSGLLFAACEENLPFLSPDSGKTWNQIGVEKTCARFTRHAPSSSVFGFGESFQDIMRFNEKGTIQDYWFNKSPSTAKDMAVDSTGRFYFAASDALWTGQFINAAAIEAGVSGNMNRVAVNAANQVFVGDFEGNVYYRKSTTFEKCRTGLPGATIRALAVLPDQRILAGTDWGLFISKSPTVVVTSPIQQQPADTDHPFRIGIQVIWKSVPYARYYHLQIARDSAFTDFLVNDSTMSVTTKALPLLGFGERYYWRVRSILAAQRSEWTPVWTFTTLPDVPKTPQLQFPENNTNVNGASTTLQWKAGQYAERYRLQVSNVPNFATILVEDSTLTTESYELQNLGQDTKYYWRVHSINLTGSSGWTTAWSFVANPNIGVEEPQTGGIQVYPNPANEEIVVQFPALITGKAEIIILSSIGETLRHIPVNTPVSEVKIGVKDLASGRYSLRILSGGTEQVVPIAIQR